MKVIIMMACLFPAIGCSSGITIRNEVFDRVEDPSISSKIIIDINKKKQVIDNQFYGSHLDSYSQIPTKSVVDELRLGKIRVGGNEFDVLNWKINKSITSTGEIMDVPSLKDYAEIVSSFNLDSIFQVNLTGYQPEMISGKYVINRSFSANSAYEMIKHLNGKLGLAISNISLGNEFSIWHETHPKVWQGQDGISADEYIDRYIQYAIAIRRAQSEVNGNANSIKLWGPEISTSWYDWNTGNFSKDCEWTDTTGQVACKYGNGKFTHFIPYFLYRLRLAEKDLKINPKSYKLIDYLSIHYYSNFRTKNDDPSSVVADENGRQLIEEILQSTRLFNDPNFINKYDISSFKNTSPNILGRMNQWINDYYPKVKLAINEFAVDADYRSNYYHPIIRPLYLADSIGIFSKEGVSFMNQFLLSSAKEGNLPWSLIESGNKRNLFYMYKLFTNNFLGTVVEVDDNLGNLVNSYATVQNSIVNLALINKESNNSKVQVYIKDKTLNKLITFTIPGWSAAILKFDSAPNVSKKTFEVNIFGAEEMKILLDASDKIK